MKKMHWLTVLMVVTLIVITGFQVYWLKDNYDREKRAMQIKAKAAFEETVEQLQAAKLKLPPFILQDSLKSHTENIIVNTSLNKRNETLPNVKGAIKNTNANISIKQIIRHDKRITINNLGDSIKFDSSSTIVVLKKDSNGIIKFPSLKAKQVDSSHSKIFIQERFGNDTGAQSRRQFITMINAIKAKLQDTIKSNSSVRGAVIFALNKNSLHRPIKPTQVRLKPVVDSSNHIFSILYSVDSLQDSIKIPEIQNAYSARLKKENINISFTITKTERPIPGENMADAAVGFAHPVNYHLTLLNVPSYVFRRISMPMLFSIFLVGAAILSFTLLYRNLLRQQRLAEIKNEFISNITHELKTPIATVGVAIEALKNFNAMHDPEKTKEYLDISGNELQRLSLLVDKVLKLSMFEKKQIELNKENFDLKQLTQEVLDSMRLQFEKQKAHVTFNSEGESFIINADKLHITSVIYNLLDNALKYSKEEPVIDVLLSSHNNLELKVADKGVGIAPEYQNKIFDKFFRVPTGNKHAVKGYGLGLSYVSEIVKRHQGSIAVESELGKGSTFIIKLPVNAEA